MKQCRFLAISCLATLFVVAASATAAPKEGKGKGNNRTTPSLTCDPAEIRSPLRPDQAMTICLSGFDAGDLLTVRVPWMGTPDAYSQLIYSRYVDATGGFCFTSPPEWTTMELLPGNYSIETSWQRNGKGGGNKQGPTESLVVLEN